MGDLKNDIDRYLKGEMSAPEMHALEKRALDDPFLADALEGGAAYPDNFTADIDGLNARIAAKVERKPGRVPWYYQAAAAALLLGVTTLLIFYLSNRQQTVTPLTMNQQTEKSIREDAPPTDTTHRQDYSTPSEQPTEERVAETEVTRPASPQADITTRRASEAQAADIAPEEPVSAAPAEAEDIAPPPSSDRLPEHDSMQARSFARRQVTKKEAAGKPVTGAAQLSRIRAADEGRLTIRRK